MSYGRVPYAVRYLVALVAWLALLALTLVFKFFLIPCIPIIFLMSGFGYNQTQNTAQYNATLIDLFVYKWPRFPRADWRRLLGRRRSAYQAADPGFIEDVGHSRT